ncbi:aminotransferase class III-fold pyridoxal phosphate-dependent enzyme [Paenarthrobacter sp. UW852]|uniref:aspartate aminotransferase family protein n=1 Tax=Paenarthrobacter sp. UW852 TaxID=2951989 RepID=UPI0021493415|nr:aminotransferase class III-fold pyridoxal phosphate-dependent enzyme [Paenarthrobacter sp. UW852]MCR1160364.1 aminotransferase class III-fold pyridoxal phosphate-dependent enzyme [Paenarthrobacter sp. UW852]
MVVDANGHSVIDCNNNYTSLIHGHANAEILDAAFGAARQGTAFGLPTRYEVDMAECLAERTGIQQWRFCNSGTEAVLMMLRAARAHTGRDLIIRFEGSYHGTGDEVSDQHSLGLAVSTRQSVIVLPQGDIEALTDTMRRVGDKTAAILIDLMPNRAGLRPAEPEFVNELRKLADQHGALLAVDEVISLRLHWGGFHKHYDVEPDLISAGKIIGGGFPAGAIGGSSAILKSFRPGDDRSVMWGGTFTANPVTMAAGLTAMRLYDKASVAALNAAGDRLRGELQSAGVAVNGFGSLLRISTTGMPSLWWKLYNQGVLAGTNGLLALSTAMSEEHLSRIQDTVVKSMTQIHDE